MLFGCNTLYQLLGKILPLQRQPRQNGRHFPDDIFKWIFLNETLYVSLKISLKFVLRFRISNILPLVLILAWRRLGEKPLSEPMMTDVFMKIQPFVWSLWQERWDKEVGNKLHTIMPQIDEKYYSGCTNRKDEVIINRLRIGHTRLTHSFRMEIDLPPLYVISVKGNTS